MSILGSVFKTFKSLRIRMSSSYSDNIPPIIDVKSYNWFSESGEQESESSKVLPVTPKNSISIGTLLIF